MSWEKVFAVMTPAGDLVHPSEGTKGRRDFSSPMAYGSVAGICQAICKKAEKIPPVASGPHVRA
jgi:hypothetical protein